MLVARLLWWKINYTLIINKEYFAFYLFGACSVPRRCYSEDLVLQKNDLVFIVQAVYVEHTFIMFETGLEISTLV